MKAIKIKLSLTMLAGSLLFVSCDSSTSSKENKEAHHEAMEHDHSTHEHGNVTEDRNVANNVGTDKGEITPVLNEYFSLNASLVKDDASAAASVSGKLVSALNIFKGTNLSENEQKEVNDILESAIENAEHISKNAGEIDHQREHLVSLSTDIKDLITIIGTSQKLYEDFCPMANNNEGAIWISNQKEISNPYMGSKMPKCGKVNREIN